MYMINIIRVIWNLIADVQSNIDVHNSVKAIRLKLRPPCTRDAHTVL